MSNYNYKKLQNGSDIRGVALEGIPSEPVNLTQEAVTRIAKGFVYWLSNKTGKTPNQLSIAIGQDSRLSGDMLCNWFSEAVLKTGAKILSAGLASTPAMFMATIFPDFKADGSTMITASHLPFNRNGFKFFDKDGGLNKGDITDIIIFAESDSVLNRIIPCEPQKPQEIDLMEVYAQHLRELIKKGTGDDKPLEGMKIVVDAGNGAGGFFADNVLAKLGADVSDSQFLNPDGNFPNHAPNPEDKKAMASICSQVKKAKAHLGLIFDTDVDRSSAVDEKGNEISRNGIVAMAAALIADQYPKTTIVTDSITSTHLTDFLEKSLNVKHLRYQRGYKNVINKAISLNSEGIDSQLAIETSGHAAYKENFFLDDGAYLATKITIKAANLFKEGKYISSVISNLSTAQESEEIRFPIKASDFSSYGDKVISALTSWVDTLDKTLGASVVSPNYEGIRIAFNGSLKGWFLLRKSLHDPIMPLNLESDLRGGVSEMRLLLKDFFLQFNEIDSSKL